MARVKRLTEQERNFIGDSLSEFVVNPCAMNLTRFVNDHQVVQEALEHTKATHKEFETAYDGLLVAIESVLPEQTEEERRKEWYQWLND